MIANRNRWLAWCAAVTLLAGGDSAVAQPWPVVEQPELKQALLNAPLLQTESLGEPARGVNVWERWMVPNPDGEGWDVLQLYFKEYYGPTWLYVFDLGTGKVKSQRLPDEFQFYLSGRALGLDGKYYIATPYRRTWNMHLFVYDPVRSWTLGKAGPPGHSWPNENNPASNPHRIGEFRESRVAIMHSSAVGADGKIYFGGFGVRNYTGGGLGFYDPETGKLDCLWKPFSGYAVYWIVPVLDGRLIAVSTKSAADELKDNQAPEEAKLFFYNVADGEITREIVPIAKGQATGLIVEVAPGRLLALTADGEHAESSILYGVDVMSGQVLFRKSLPSRVSTDAYWPHWVDPSYVYEHLTLGPDGFVWAFLKNVLVRIDPKDARVHVVGKIDPVGYPTFIGNDVYFAGSEQLRRIRNIGRYTTDRPEPTGR